jgi:hypothetical protein
MPATSYLVSLPPSMDSTTRPLRLQRHTKEAKHRGREDQKWQCNTAAGMALPSAGCPSWIQACSDGRKARMPPRPLTPKCEEGDSQECTRPARHPRSQNCTPAEDAGTLHALGAAT